MLQDANCNEHLSTRSVHAVAGRLVRRKTEGLATLRVQVHFYGNSRKELPTQEITQYRRILCYHKPVLVLCFGQFAFAFARWANQEEGQGEFRSWSVKELAREFANGISNFQAEQVNVLPPLHASIARGRFLHCHEEFSGS